MKIFKKHDKATILSDELSKIRRYCICSHSVYIPYPLMKINCSYCNRFVYIDFREEFKDKLSKLLKIENNSKRERGV